MFMYVYIYIYIYIYIIKDRQSFDHGHGLAPVLGSDARPGRRAPAPIQVPNLSISTESKQRSIFMFGDM